MQDSYSQQNNIQRMMMMAGVNNPTTTNNSFSRPTIPEHQEFASKPQKTEKNGVHLMAQNPKKSLEPPKENLLAYQPNNGINVGGPIASDNGQSPLIKEVKTKQNETSSEISNDPEYIQKLLSKLFKDCGESGKEGTGQSGDEDINKEI